MKLMIFNPNHKTMQSNVLKVSPFGPKNSGWTGTPGALAVTSACRIPGTNLKRGDIMEALPCAMPLEATGFYLMIINGVPSIINLSDFKTEQIRLSEVYKLRVIQAHII